MQIWGKTDIGLLRKQNEDSIGFEILDDNFAWAAVCDGVGGAQGGKIASKSVIDDLIKEIYGIYKHDYLKENIKEICMKILENSNKKIFKKAKAEALDGMGTTLVLAIFLKPNVYIFYVGDSRAYLIDPKENNIRKLTQDHSLVQEMISRGEITKEQAKIHPERHIITRAIGVNENISVDCLEFIMPQNFKLLLCSDGLSNHLDKNEILEIMLKYESKNVTEKLIETANLRGGEDNISVIVIENFF